MAAKRVVLAAALLAFGCWAPRPRLQPVPAVSLLGAGPLVVPFDIRLSGFRVGGLSAIARAADGTYVAVVDGEGETPARVVRLAFRVSEDGIAPPPGRTPGQVPVAAIGLAGLDGRNFDGEGIVVEPSGRMLVSSETEPSVRELSAEGELVAALPVPPLFLASGRKGIRNNQGFESLTLTPDGKSLWTANERALQQDGADDETRPSPVRLLRYDRRGGAGFVPGPQFVYPVEPIDHPGAGFSIRGLAELLALPGGDLLALEREFVTSRGFKIQLYRVSLAGATDVSAFDTLAGKTYTPVHKTLLYDFARAGFVPDNLEGMTFGPPLRDGSRTLVLVSDDNFSPLQQTQLVALRWIESAP